MRRFKVVPKNQIREEVVRLLRAVKLDEFYYDRLPRQLSGGEKQRVQLARELAQIWDYSLDAIETNQTYKATQTAQKKAPVLLLDEPTNALDPGHQKMLVSKLKAFKKAGYLIVMALHDVNLASQISDCIIALRTGNIVAQGAPLEILKKPLLDELFETDNDVFMHPEQGYPVYL